MNTISCSPTINQVTLQNYFNISNNTKGATVIATLPENKQQQAKKMDTDSNGILTAQEISAWKASVMGTEEPVVNYSIDNPVQEDIMTLGAGSFMSGIVAWLPAASLYATPLAVVGIGVSIYGMYNTLVSHNDTSLSSQCVETTVSSVIDHATGK